MMDMGAEEEVRALLDLDLNASQPIMKALGVAQITRALEGKISIKEAVEFSKTAIRQYAKRQETWFRNRFALEWTRL